jgi:hypothetical protein
MTTKAVVTSMPSMRAAMAAKKVNVERLGLGRGS